MSPTPVPEVVDYVFRHESGRLIAVLTRIFGAENLEMAEDVVQDSMLEALHHWKTMPNLHRPHESQVYIHATGLEPPTKKMA